jgi:hypothetical protein
VPLHRVHDRARHRPFVKGDRADGRDLAQHVGKLRVAQRMAHGVGLAIRPVEVGGGDRVLLQRGLGQQERVQARADREALLGKRDGGLEQPRPRQLAVLAVRQCQHRQRAGHADRAAARHRVHESQRLALCAEEQAFIGPGGGGLATVEGLQAPAVVVQQEGTAADAAGLRLHQREHHLHRDRGVHRAAAGAQDPRARFGRQRIGRGDGLALEGPARFGREAGGGFGLLNRWRGRRGAGGEQRQAQRKQR